MQINSTPLRQEQLSFDEQLVRKTGLDLIQSVQRWKKGKLYKFPLEPLNCTEDSKCEVQTYGETIDGDYWLCRQSTHNITPENYRKVVQVLNGSQWDQQAGKWDLSDTAARSKQEQEYIEVLSKCHVTKQVAENGLGWVLVNLEYELGKPLTTREFNEWVCPLAPVVCQEQGLETSLVVSLVADEQIRDPVNHTRAHYASVEQLKYDRTSHVLEWTMCTTSDAGGNVPKWIQNATIARTVVKDVPYLLNWMQKRGD
ncbi:unnamed protein product [Kluyveromyces dobzhanskii CBS 2104]|uniref:WGS project CCBQ000000000 data, contig 00041 n=1 Tax=Kluyveromyces dobzhanskii CBS 2104 TaxID=1427455 RepID=A0A0A8L2L9_9SACH|nr:unnamed protein product [Kluyveromyces dobzhanskii CBS 2104]